jgi:hypothetical protein
MMKRPPPTVAALCLGLSLVTYLGSVRAADREPAAAKASGKLAFAAEGKEFRFDTGVSRGILRPQGRSFGLASVVDLESGSTISGGGGLFSHYRLLDAEARYGGGAWDWPSDGRLLADGAVAGTWSSRPGLPFEMTALYRWTAPNALDLTTSVTPSKDLERIEVFLASYFAGFPESLVYVKGCPQTNGRPGLLPATRANGDWQMFPRDDAAIKVIQDGRWKRPPNPVDWKIMPPLAGALAVRRDAKTGLTALLMARAEDCFAIATPYGEEGHRSIYLSLLGRDIKAGRTATVRSRLVIGRKISDEQAVAMYEAYVKERGNAGK